MLEEDNMMCLKDLDFIIIVLLNYSIHVISIIFRVIFKIILHLKLLNWIIFYSK